MDLFQYRRGMLHCEDVPLQKIADSVGTPTYVYSLGTVLEHYRRLVRAFHGVDCQIYYSVKANSNMALMAALAREECGFDVFSGGELFRVRRAGGKMRRTVFAGVGKTEAELAAAVKAGIEMFNMESWPEAELLNSVARKLGRRVKADFRINPNVDAHTHAHITTGRSENKFGVPIAQAPELYGKARRLSHVEVCGVHLHIGSQITDVSPYQAAIRKTLTLVKALRARGHKIETFNLGGGLGIIYDRERPSTAQQFAESILPLIQGQGLRLLLEPGRFIVGNAGMMLTRVLYIKPAASKTFVIVDSGMNDLIRPTLYDAYHAIVPLSEREARGERKKVDVVGPICESGDFLAKNRLLALPRAGQCLAVRSTGAYGFVMSSNYNSRPRAAEVLVDGRRFFVVRRRETLADLVRGESIPVHLKRRARG
jgi:diaminopimelate decarboxylase